MTIMSSHCFLGRADCNSGVPYDRRTPWVLENLTCGFIQDTNWELKVWPVYPWFHRHPGKLEFHNSSNPVTAVVQKQRKSALFHVTLEWEFVLSEILHIQTSMNKECGPNSVSLGITHSFLGRYKRNSPIIRIN